ncbi:scarecrow-like protein 34 [Miscanthus floridulus]|uniref:scarecrow-like protein 34 n=1 Tax=Miscanthus floridulus TaxID=154761 RepID=UPI0034593042
MGSSYDPSPLPGADGLLLYLSDLGPTAPSAYLDPSSPSDYLDLPPTPQPQQQQGNIGPAQDMLLPYISSMLMEDDIDDTFFYDYPDNPALLQAQQSFLDVLSDDASSPTTTNSSASASVNHHSSGPASAPLTPAAVDSYAPAPAAQFDGFDLDPAAFFSNGANSDLMSSAFLKGMEEANKFLPTQDKLVIDLDPPDDPKRFVLPTPAPAADKLAPGFNAAAIVPAAVAVAVKEEEVVFAAPGSGGGAFGGRGRRNRFDDDDDDDLELQRRISKQSALQGDGDERDVFEKYIITDPDKCTEQMQNLRIAMQEAAAAGNGKAKGRRGGRDVVDLRTLLVHCAQAVASDDRRSATELLRQIKQHASPQGDATQRLAHCFAEGLQARLAGTGSMVYQSLMAKRTSVADILQAYQLYMDAICFKRVVFVFSNYTIYNAALGKKKIHIVEYGINYGFQWPCFLRWIADREGGPPELRITGIDLPQPGFRPTQRIEETGRRLSKYAQQFGVPFKYQAIAASKMESIRAEDLNLDPEEVLIVNCLYQFKNLMDESVVIESPRDIMLNNIRKMRPHTFIHAIVNGSFSAPFFVSRFREALFFYSALFDALDATTPRDSNQRMLIEENLFGRAALNVIACEGTDRVERPETYKQWQVRNQRAGLKQQPLNPDVVQVVRNKVKDFYHKDFVIDVDHHWLLQGWKGRILYAISTWVANDAPYF